MSRIAPRPIAEAMRAMTATLAPATTLARVQERWESVAGELVAKESTPVAGRAGVLTLRCSSAVWAQELELMGGELVGALNEALGEPAIRELRCRTGR